MYGENNKILTVVLTREGEEKLLEYYAKICRLSSFLGTNYMINPKEEMDKIRNKDGSYMFTIPQLINIITFDNSYIKKISNSNLTKKLVLIK